MAAVGTRDFQPLAAVLEEVVTPGGQPVCFDLKLAGELIEQFCAQQA
jgi:hypothetical protein